jgi:hypothetical protein
MEVFVAAEEDLYQPCGEACIKLEDLGFGAVIEGGWMVLGSARIPAARDESCCLKLDSRQAIVLCLVAFAIAKNHLMFVVEGDSNPEHLRGWEDAKAFLDQEGIGSERYLDVAQAIGLAPKPVDVGGDDSLTTLTGALF